MWPLEDMTDVLNKSVGCGTLLRSKMLRAHWHEMFLTINKVHQHLCARLSFLKTPLVPFSGWAHRHLEIEGKLVTSLFLSHSQLPNDDRETSY